MSDQRWRNYRALGLCGRCGAEPVPGKTRCLACQEKNRRAVAATFKARTARGECARCGAPAQGHFLCERHAADNRLYVSRHNRRKRALASDSPRTVDIPKGRP